MLTPKSLSVVVACYNDAGSVHEMHRRLTAALSTLTPNYEIIYANDASPDNAEALLLELVKRDPHLTVITHARNFGSQMAFTSGMLQATGDGVIFMDGDLQDPPEVITSFVEKWLEGYDVVYGVRVRRQGSLFRRVAYKTFYRLFRKLSYLNIPLDAGDFALMDRKVVEALKQFPERDRFLRGLRAYVGFKQTGVPYARAERFAGESTNSLGDNLRWARKGIFSFSYAPLELISHFAWIVLLVSFVAIVYYIALYFVKADAPPGFTTQLVITLFLGGVQLLCLSIIGEYLGRLFEEVKQRPLFIVKSIHKHHADSDSEA